jgi:hypothetical protein
VIADVAGYDDEVWHQRRRPFHEVFHIFQAHASPDVQIAEVEDPQALQIVGQVREVEGDEWNRRRLRRPQRAYRGEPGAQEVATPD